ncbi:MAG TPA: magnesium transporter [Myxococcota bacterium]
MAQPELERDRSDAPAWERLPELALAGDREGLANQFDALSEAERIHAFGRLSNEDRGRVLALLDPERAALLLESVPDVHAGEAVRELEPSAAADILGEMLSDEGADLLGYLHADAAEAILAEAEPGVAANVRSLLQYPTDTAGGLMITEYVAVPEWGTAQDVIDHMRAEVERYADYPVQYVYVVGPGGELHGVLPLRDLLLARRSRPIASLMVRDPVSVGALASHREIVDIFERYDYVGVPVVDEAGVLVGVLLREDVDEARVDNAEADALKARGIVGGDELRSLPLMLRSRRRLSWLSINIVLNVLAASVIALYEDTLSAVIALAVFLPLISDMSGCSGNQAVAVSLRELTLGVTRPNEIARVLFKESAIGILNGIVLGVLIGLVAWAWKGNAMLALVVGSALALNTLVAVCIGGAVPLFLRRLNVDPALASGPMLTTITDMCGFFLVLSFATLALSQITP